MEVFKSPPKVQGVTRWQRKLGAAQGLYIPDHRLNIPIPNIETNHEPSAGIVPLNLVDPGFHGHRCDFAQWNAAPIAAGNGQIPDGLRVLAEFIRHTQNEVKAFFVFDYFPHFAPGISGLNLMVHIGDIQTVACQRWTVKAYHGLGEAFHRFHPNLHGTGDFLDQGADFFAQTAEAIEVLPVDFDHHILLGAGHEFVETHRHRVLKTKGHPGYFFEGLGHAGRELFPRRSRGPLGRVLEDNHEVGGLHGHGIGGDFSAAYFAHDLDDFGVTLPDQGRGLKHRVGGGLQIGSG